MGRIFHIENVPDFPLQLADPGFDPCKGSGYNMRDTNTVLEQVATGVKAGFLDTYELLKRDDRSHTIDRYFDAIEKPTLVSGEVFVYPGQDGGYKMLDVVMGLVKQTQEQGLGPRRVIMPLNVAFAAGTPDRKDDHAMVLLVEAHPARGSEYRIALLEQHARRDGGKLDYSREKAAVLDHLRQYYPKAQMVSNDAPFCTEERACGIVSLAACKKLLTVAESFEFAGDARNLAMTRGDVEAEHAGNVKLAMRAAGKVDGSASGMSGGRGKK